VENLDNFLGKTKKNTEISVSRNKKYQFPGNFIDELFPENSSTATFLSRCLEKCGKFARKNCRRVFVQWKNFSTRKFPQDVFHITKAPLTFSGLDLPSRAIIIYSIFVTSLLSLFVSRQKTFGKFLLHPSAAGKYA
jgi:hypothetical protein